MTPYEAQQRIIRHKLDELVTKLVEHILSPDAPNFIREMAKMNFAKGGYVTRNESYLVGEYISPHPANHSLPVKHVAPGSLNITITVKNRA